MAALLDVNKFVPSESILGMKRQMFALNRADKTPMRSRPAPPQASDDILDSKPIRCHNKSARSSFCPRESLNHLIQPIKPLVELYDKHGGNLTKLFEELGEDPGKALKYPPATGPEFAAKYVEGRYTYVANIEKIRSSVLDKLDGDEDLLEGIDPDMPELMDEPLHPLDILRALFPDIDDIIIEHVWEATEGNLEEAAAGLWFLKITAAFMAAGAQVDLPELPPEEMSTKELLAEIKRDGLDASQCVEKSELVAVVQAGRAAKA